MKLVSALAMGAWLSAAVALAAAHNQPSERLANLSGAWELNREASSPTPAGLGPEDDGGRPPGKHGGGHGPGGGRGGFGGPGMGGMGGGMHGGPGSGGAQPDREEMARQRELVHEVVASPVRLLIDHDGSTVSFTDDEGHVRRYAATGKSEKHQLTSGTVDTKTHWDVDTLVIETELPRSMKVTRRYAFSMAGEVRQLVVTTEIEGGGSPGGGRRPPLKAVYDPAVKSE